MPTVAVNAPKTPVTQGSSSIAAATLPNVCKMPGPPAPFVPAPLPNIGMSGTDAKGYSKKVKIEGQPVAIQGASFGSQGDVASKGTGGGVVSSNTHGPTKFVGPGSLNVKIEGKNVHLLGDPMLNNCGPSGAPANAATMGGALHSPLPPGAPAAGDKDPCDHDWQESNPGKSPADAKASNQALVTSNANKPSMAEEMRGLQFENHAVDDNLPKMNIQAVGRVYTCSKCGQEQEVDVVGDRRIAEAKSRKFKGVKNSGKQCKRLRDIQQKKFDPSRNPLAKIDGTIPDSAQSVSKYLERGFDVEVL